MIVGEDKMENKTELSKKLGVSRSSLYYKAKRDDIDEEVAKTIRKVLSTHKSYGHKRIAAEIGLNKKRILRVMKKYGIKPYRRRVKILRKKEDEGKEQTRWKNEIKGFSPIRPNIVWSSDFTYIKFMNKFIYLGTIIDIYTREIIGWHISDVHNTELVLKTLMHAIERTRTVPNYLHSDQGSEYSSKVYEEFVLDNRITLSMSNKSSPWENAYQESFYSQFKVDLGMISRFETLEELIEEIYQTIYYYNNKRFHSSLKMSPVLFKQKYINSLQKVLE